MISTNQYYSDSEIRSALATTSATAHADALISLMPLDDLYPASGRCGAAVDRVLRAQGFADAANQIIRYSADEQVASAKESCRRAGHPSVIVTKDDCYSS